MASNQIGKSTHTFTSAKVTEFRNVFQQFAQENGLIKITDIGAYPPSCL